MFNVAYGVGKAGLDRMSVDCGIELKAFNVCCTSLMLGAVRTELTSGFISKEGEQMKMKGDPSSKQDAMSVKTLFEQGETVEFGGKIVVAMAQDPHIMRMSSRIVIGAEYARKKGLVDIDGRQIPTHRELSFMAPYILPKSMRRWAANSPLAKSIKVPQSILDIANSKYFRF